MKSNYKELLIGGILTSIIFIMGSLIEGFIVRYNNFIFPVYIAINTFFFLLLWIVISLLLNKFPLYQVLTVLGILLLVACIEYYFNLPDNPLTIPLLILFWMGVCYLIIPEFFKRHKFVIIALNAMFIIYYLVFRSSPSYINFHRFIVSIFLILSISSSIIIWGFSRWKWLTNLQTEKANTELMILKNQINPHFFFNTLNNLYGLAVEKSDKTPEMILKLSDIMRYTIYEGNVDFVSLKKEILYLEDYIDLHKIRYQKKVKISVIKDISHSHKIAPILLIIPLENAFKHGVESLTENAFININIKTSMKHIFFKIKNNFTPIENENKGLGMDNLKNRLSLIYPQKHQLKVVKSAGIYELYLSIEVI